MRFMESRGSESSTENLVSSVVDDIGKGKWRTLEQGAGTDNYFMLQNSSYLAQLQDMNAQLLSLVMKQTYYTFSKSVYLQIVNERSYSYCTIVG